VRRAGAVRARNWRTRLRWKDGGDGRPRGPTRSTVDAMAPPAVAG